MLFFCGKRTSTDLRYLNNSRFLHLRSWFCGMTNVTCLLKPGKCFSIVFFDVWLLWSLLAGCAMSSCLPMGMFSLSRAVSAHCSRACLDIALSGRYFFILAGWAQSDDSELSWGRWEEGCIRNCGIGIVFTFSFWKKHSEIMWGFFWVVSRRHRDKRLVVMTVLTLSYMWCSFFFLSNESTILLNRDLGYNHHFLLFRLGSFCSSETYLGMPYLWIIESSSSGPSSQYHFLFDKLDLFSPLLSILVFKSWGPV